MVYRNAYEEAVGVINGDQFESVVPAQAGTHVSELCSLWIPAFAGMTVL